MGLFSTIGSFTAGYLVGARRRTPVSPATALPPFDTRRVSELMTSSPKTLPSDATLSAAAKIMEADDIGDVANRARLQRHAGAGSKARARDSCRQRLVIGAASCQSAGRCRLAGNDRAPFAAVARLS